MLLELRLPNFQERKTIITESTYGGAEDFMPSRVEAEERLTQVINATLERKGKVLIPVPAVGRAQEIMLIIDGYMKRGLMKEAPVFIEGMILRQQPFILPILNIWVGKSGTAFFMRK